MEKWAIITGGTKGIGKALVEKFSGKGFSVITCSRSQDSITEIEKSVSGKVFGLACDLSEKSEVLRFAEFVQSITNRVDVLVNNVGVFLPGDSMTEPDENFEKQMAINVNAMYYLTKALQVNYINGESFIGNICSTASFMAYTNGGSYCISKFAALGFTKVLREEMKEREIAVSAIMPGATFTSSWEGTELPESRFIKTTDVSEAVYLAYDNRKTAVMEEIVLRPVKGDI